MRFDPLIGRQLASYRIEQLIGRGGMAAVYYATDIQLNRPAAIKVIDPNHRANESYTTRFILEARSIASWRHENIVQIYHAGEADGMLYYAMEYIDGVNLAQIISAYTTQGKRLPVPDVLRYGRAIASALDYAHKKGVIHRDVKPLNVLVASDGRVVLTDFGIALNTTLGSIGEVFGSPQYIAPEQARRSNEAVPQSDLYSLGVMLYEMLTGSLPFDDSSPTSLALQHMIQPPPSPRQINPSLSSEVEVVLLRTLSKNPSDRYQTGHALMDALENALLFPVTPGATNPARPPMPPFDVFHPPAIPLTTSSKPIPAYRPRGRFRRPFLATAGILLLIIGVILLLVLRQSPGLSNNPSVLFNNATPTLKYSDRRGFKLYYNKSSFYMYQSAGVGDLIAGVRFERLDDKGRLLNSFSGNRWAQFSESSLLNWCFRLEITDAGGYMDPLECGDRYLATLHLSPRSSEVFWTSQAGSHEFRVLWWDEELVRCEISVGYCEVNLP